MSSLAIRGDLREVRYDAARRYRVLVSDPPWRFEDKLGRKRGAERQYAVLPFDELAALPLPPLEKDAFLFLWRVSSQVEEACRLIRAWGFVPKSEVAWLKKTSRGNRHFGMGRTVRHEHETVMIATRGKARVRCHNVRSTFEAPVGRHSEKPEAFFALVERLCAGPYVEIFARRPRRGWTTVGNELVAPPARARRAA